MTESGVPDRVTARLIGGPADGKETQVLSGVSRIRVPKFSPGCPTSYFFYSLFGREISPRGEKLIYRYVK